eukprot:5486251-Pleurochrysis_carterae.AAC.6
MLANSACRAAGEDCATMGVAAVYVAVKPATLVGWAVKAAATLEPRMASTGDESSICMGRTQALVAVRVHGGRVCRRAPEP